MSFGQTPFVFNPFLPVSSQPLLIPTSVGATKAPSEKVSASLDAVASSIATASFSQPSLVPPTFAAAPMLTPEAMRLFNANFPGGGFPPIALHHPGGLPPAELRGMSHGGMPPLGFYPGFSPTGTGLELKSPADLLPPGMTPHQPPPFPGYYFDPAFGAGYPYDRFGNPLDLNGARRKNATRETTAALKAWLYEHRKNPYPTKGEKIMLAIITKMTLTQVSTWFANARRRLKKENKMTWSPRNRTGEDDDDDDIGRPDGLEGVEDDEEPESSSPDGQTIIPADGIESLHAQVPELKRLPEKRPASPATSTPSEPPSPVKKAKVWSIVDTLGTDKSEASEAATASKPADVTSNAPSSCVLPVSSHSSAGAPTPAAFPAFFAPWATALAVRSPMGLPMGPVFSGAFAAMLPSPGSTMPTAEFLAARGLPPSQLAFNPMAMMAQQTQMQGGVHIAAKTVPSSSSQASLTPPSKVAGSPASLGHSTTASPKSDITSPAQSSGEK